MDRPSIIIGRPTKMPTIVILIRIPIKVKKIPNIKDNPFPTKAIKNNAILNKSLIGKVIRVINNLSIILPPSF